MFRTIWIYLLILTQTDAANILAIYPTPSMSHQTTLLAVSKALSLRGHRVVTITANPLNDKTLTNHTEIDISFVFDTVKNDVLLKMFDSDRNFLERVIDFKKLTMYHDSLIFEKQEVKNIINSGKTFDLILVEAHDVVFFTLGWKFEAPVVAISTYFVILDLHDALGNPTHPIFTADNSLSYQGLPDIPFSVKIRNLISLTIYRILLYWYYLPQQDAIARKYLGSDMPYLGDILTKTSLLLVNTNSFTDCVRPKLPNVIEIEHIHIREPKPLTKSLKDYLDSSKNGAIYFSLGTNINSLSFDNETLNGLIQTFRSLPFNVLWKFDTKIIPNLPNNVLIRKWFPQQDLLGHPNIKAFVTQGGIHSIEEAITHGVPLVGIPFIIDQPKNIRNMAKWGAAIQLHPEDMKKESLREAIVEIATNRSYKTNILKIKALIRDQPMWGIEKVIWWIEYALRHKGAEHLEYPGAKLPFYKYLMLDVFGILFSVSFFLIFSTWQCLKFLMAKTRNYDKIKSKHD